MSEWILSQDQDCPECQLWKMGLDASEQEQIIEIGNAFAVSGAGVGPVELGQVIMNFRTIPVIRWEDMFVFRWHWPTTLKCNMLLTLSLILIALWVGIT